MEDHEWTEGSLSMFELRLCSIQLLCAVSQVFSPPSSHVHLCNTFSLFFLRIMLPPNTLSLTLIPMLFYTRVTLSLRRKLGCFWIRFLFILILFLLFFFLPFGEIRRGEQPDKKLIFFFCNSLSSNLWMTWLRGRIRAKMERLLRYFFFCLVNI